MVQSGGIYWTARSQRAVKRGKKKKGVSRKKRNNLLEGLTDIQTYQDHCQRWLNWSPYFSLVLKAQVNPIYWRAEFRLVDVGIIEYIFHLFGPTVRGTLVQAEGFDDVRLRRNRVSLLVDSHSLYRGEEQLASASYPKVGKGC